MKDKIKSNHSGSAKIRIRLLIFPVILFFFIFFINCRDNGETKLEKALLLSGSNLGELEKVLDYFSKNPEDSLKLKSAIFLIENMPGHWGPSSNSIHSYKTKIDSIPGVPFEMRKMLLNLPSQYPELCQGFARAEDVHTIKANDLIRYIERVCRLKDSCTWLENIDMDVFCEYILPYRLENEFVEFSSDTIEDESSKLIDYALKNYDDCQYSTYSISTRIPEKTEDYTLKDSALSKLLLTIDNRYKMAVIRLREKGIPVALDYTPIHYPHKNNNYWYSTIDPNFITKSNDRTEEVSVGKIYRQTFSHNPIPVVDSSEFVPPFFRNPFQKDITDIYLYTTDVTLSVKMPEKIHYAYLAMYNEKEWLPIAYSKVENGQAQFNKLGKDCVYLPVYYPQGQQQTLGAPFILRSTGQVHPLTAPDDSIITLHTERFGPFLYKENYYGEYLKNSCFECANNDDFKNPDTAFIIEQLPFYRLQDIQLTRKLKKRYWRFSFSSKNGTLSELQFLNHTGEQFKGMYFTNNGKQINGLNDNNPSTYKTIHKWIVVDFGHPVEVSTIRYMIAHDNYTIWSGHEYELFYYQHGKWVSAGIQKAIDDSIIFSHVPANRLYQIKDNTNGVMGYAFTREKERIRFW